MALSAGQAALWNRRMGNRTGHRWRSGPSNVGSFNYTPRATRQILSGISRGSTNVPARVTRNYNRGISAAGGYSPSTSNPADIERMWNDVYGRLSNDYASAQAVQATVDATAAEEQDRASNDKPWFQNVFNASGAPALWQDISHRNWNDLGNLPNGIVPRINSLFGRGFNTVAGAANALVSQEDHQGFNAGDLGYTIANMATHAYRGLTGEEHTDPGDVYENFKNNPSFDLNAPLQALENPDSWLNQNVLPPGVGPTIEQNIARLAGVGISFGLDPLTYVTPGLPSIERSSGQVATREVMEAGARRLATQATDELLHNPTMLNHVLQADPAALVDHLANAASDAAGRAVLEVHGGAAGVKLLNPDQFPTSVATRTAAAAQQSLTADMDQALTRVLDSSINRNARGWWANQSMRRNPDVREFFQEAERRLIAAKELKPGDVVWGNNFSDVSKMLEVMDNGGNKVRTILADVRDGISQKYFPEVQAIYDSMLTGATNPTYRTLGVRVGRRTVPVKFIGRAYDTIATSLGERVGGTLGSVGKHVYEYNFAGPLSSMATSARAEGFAPVQEFSNMLEEQAKLVTPELAAQIQSDIIPLHTVTGNQVLDQQGQFVRDQYREIWNSKVEHGVSPDANHGGVYRPDYTYIHLEGGTQKLREDFYRDRAKAWADKNTPGPGKYTIEYAAQQGLKPERNAYMNLLYAYMNHRQDMTSALFLEDLLDNYGFHSDRIFSEAERRAIDSVEIPTQTLNQATRDFIQREGGAMYLPESMKDIHTLFKDIANWNTSKYNGFQRAYVRVIQEFKGLMTLPRPGFHIRNVAGDVAMGLLDGVGPKDYWDMFRRWRAYKAGKNPQLVFPGGIVMSFEDFQQLFKTSADGGYFMTDGLFASTETAGKRLRNFATSPMDPLRKISDVRESIPRMVHFYRAYYDELEALVRKGIKDPMVLSERATRAAVWRVNKFKFDYNALMPGEKKWKTLAFPFYTYLRKAIPTLMSQMFLNPKYFVQLNRYMQNNSGMASDAFNNAHLPSWMREIGGMFLPGQNKNEDEPLFMTQDILPMGALNIIQGLPNVQTTATNVLSNLNPIAQLPLELNSGHELYSGKPIPSNLMDYIMNKVPFLNAFQDEVYNVPGLPGGNSNTALLNGGGVWNIDRLNNGLTGLGIPVHRVSRDQQYQQMQGNRDYAIDEPVMDFNRSQDRYSMRYDDDGTFSLYDKLSKEVVRTGFPTAYDAIQWAQSNLGMSYQQPRVNPLNPVQGSNVDSVLQSIAQIGQ